MEKNMKVNFEYLKELEAKNIVFASNSKNKLREVRQILEPLGFEVLSLKDVNVNIDPEETGLTFSENALLKAEAIYNEIVKVTGRSIPVIADDTGLCINSLNGFPGIMTKRFADGDEEEKNDLENNLEENNEEKEQEETENDKAD